MLTVDNMKDILCIDSTGMIYSSLMTQPNMSYFEDDAWYCAPHTPHTTPVGIISGLKPSYAAHAAEKELAQHKCPT
jgi:hypothetical protein